MTRSYHTRSPVALACALSGRRLVVVAVAREPPRRGRAGRAWGWVWGWLKGGGR